MESHGARSTATRRGVHHSQAESASMPLDVRETNSDPVLHRLGTSTCPVRVHSRDRMAVVTSPQPVTSSGPIRTTTNRPVVLSGTLRRNISDFTTITIGPVPERQSSRSVPDSVSLSVPRPETDRTANEYVEAPLRCKNLPKTEPLPHRTIRTHPPPVSEASGGVDSDHTVLTLPQLRPDKVITTQPSATFKKHNESDCLRQKDSIICSDCGRCMCASCRTPRALPSKWLCGNSCYCSAESVVDYATCLCCVKAIFYHCANDESGGTACADEPCSCGPDHFYSRWGCLSLLSIALPCLFCYWPCRGLVNICESCHQYVSSRGCRCQKVHQQTPLTPQKRLLDSSPE